MDKTVQSVPFLIVNTSHMYKSERRQHIMEKPYTIYKTKIKLQASYNVCLNFESDERAGKSVLIPRKLFWIKQKTPFLCFHFHLYGSVKLQIRKRIFLILLFDTGDAEKRIMGFIQKLKTPLKCLGPQCHCFEMEQQRVCGCCTACI